MLNSYQILKQEEKLKQRFGGILSVKLNNSLTQIMNPRLSLLLIYL